MKAKHIPGRLNVAAEKLSRLGDTNRVLSPPRDISGHLPDMAPSHWICLPADTTTNCANLRAQSAT